MTAPTDAAFELLRFALLCKLAVDLDDPVLARRAARHAVTSARFLSCLEWQPEAPTDEDDDGPLLEVDDLLERLPSRREVEGGGVTAHRDDLDMTRPLPSHTYEPVSPVGGPQRGEKLQEGGSSAAPSSARGPLPPTEVPR